MGRARRPLLPAPLLLVLLTALQPERAAALRVQPVTTPVQHGEGPCWDYRTQVLYFVDISGELVNRYDPVTGNVSRIHLAGGGVSLVIPITGAVDELLVTRGRDLLHVTWDGRTAEPAAVRLVTSVEPNKPGNRFNDGKADRLGRLWAGTMGPEPVVGQVTPNQGSLYSVEPDSDKAINHLSPVSVSNGLIWTHDYKLMYYTDSPTEHVDVFDFDINNATISNRRTVFDLQAHNITGVPDGMTIDEDDNLWVAVFNGGQVLHINPRTGELLSTIKLPVSRVTSVVFGGPTLETLYVTTSSFGLSKDQLAEEPLAGSVFAVTQLGVRGVLSQTAVRTDH